ncbi:MAG TPA: enoyl-CoA hydratase-related protein, partial [Microthrixaceae bacterium]|nr:enoyl-CoA hydratase-related protein [Microthrixaceae bacterium]
MQKSIALLVPLMRSLRQPIVSAVHGAASGGGLALALGGDIRVVGPGARFNVAFVRTGLAVH